MAFVTHKVNPSETMLTGVGAAVTVGVVVFRAMAVLFAPLLFPQNIIDTVLQRGQHCMSSFYFGNSSLKSDSATEGLFSLHVDFTRPAAARRRYIT